MPKKNLARDPNNVIAAEMLHSMYEEYKKAGFTEEQAFSLTRTVLYGGIRNTKNEKN